MSAGDGGRNTYPDLARHPYRLWCHDCRGWESFDVAGPSSTGEHFFTCARCGSAILCDECGAEFGTHHVCYVVAHGGPQGGWRSEPMALAAAREEAQRLMGEGRWLSSVARPLLGEIEAWHEEGGGRWLCILATGREPEGR